MGIGVDDRRSGTRPPRHLRPRRVLVQEARCHPGQFRRRTLRPAVHELSCSGAARMGTDSRSGTSSSTRPSPAAWVSVSSCDRRQKFPGGGNVLIWDAGNVDAAGTRADQDRRAYGHDLREAGAAQFAGGRGGVKNRRPSRLRRRDAHPGRAVR